MEGTSQRSPWLRRIGISVAGLAVALALGMFAVSKADGPVFIFAGGPLVSGELVELDAIDWNRLDALHELQMEIVAAESSRTLWFSVTDGVPYVACDLDCVGGRLARWPQQIERDNRVVVRIDGKRAEAQLIFVPHESAEYAKVTAWRNEKYSGDAGGRAGAETAAHGAVVEWGEVLTGRSEREEPGDRVYRIAPR